MSERERSEVDGTLMSADQPWVRVWPYEGGPPTDADRVVAEIQALRRGVREAATEVRDAVMLAALVLFIAVVMASFLPRPRVVVNVPEPASPAPTNQHPSEPRSER